MNDSTAPSLRRHRTARPGGPLRRWQRQLSARLQAGDALARQAGWATTRTRFGGRIYRDPRFSQLTATPSPGPRQDPPHSAPASRP